MRQELVWMEENDTAGPRELPVFEGYTIDVRLREFRLVNRKNLTIEFVSFDSPKDRELLAKLNARRRAIMEEF
jgi:hypothetical protein